MKNNIFLFQAELFIIRDQCLFCYVWSGKEYIVGYIAQYFRTTGL